MVQFFTNWPINKQQ